MTTQYLSTHTRIFGEMAQKGQKSKNKIFDKSGYYNSPPFTPCQGFSNRPVGRIAGQSISNELKSHDWRKGDSRCKSHGRFYYAFRLTCRPTGQQSSVAILINFT